MLKINLLPTQRRESASASDTGQTVFIVGLAASLMVTAGGLFIFHASKDKELEEARLANVQIENSIRASRARVADHQRVLDELAEIRAKEEAISHLQAARTGPTAMLVELSHLLSPGGRPTVDPIELERIQRDNPTQMYNSTWDPHRLWLRQFSEDDRDVVIQGEGRTADDVGEFMRRMMLSQYFEDVRLERSEGAVDDRFHVAVQRFRIAARVRY